MELETLFALHYVNIRNHFLRWQTNFTEITNKPRQNPPQEVPRSSSSFSIRWHLQNSSGSFSFRLLHLELMGTNQICYYFYFLWCCEFHVKQVADMHYGMGKVTRCRDVTATEFKYCSDLNTTRFLKRIIEAEKPDFIAFTGTIIMLYNAYELWVYAQTLTFCIFFFFYMIFFPAACVRGKCWRGRLSWEKL